MVMSIIHRSLQPRADLSAGLGQASIDLPERSLARLRMDSTAFSLMPSWAPIAATGKSWQYFQRRICSQRYGSEVKAATGQDLLIGQDQLLVRSGRGSTGSQQQPLPSGHDETGIARSRPGWLVRYRRAMARRQIPRSQPRSVPFCGSYESMDSIARTNTLRDHLGRLSVSGESVERMLKHSVCELLIHSSPSGRVALPHR